MAYTWDHTRNQVRQFRASLQSRYPVQVLAIAKDFVIHDDILYFLSNSKMSSEWYPTRHLQLYQMDLQQLNYAPKTTNLSSTDFSHLPILKRSLVFSDYTAMIEKEDNQFYRQFQVPGVSAFEIKNNIIMFAFHNDIYVGELGKIPRLIKHTSNQHLQPQPTAPVHPIDNTPSSDQCHRMDPKLGGLYNDRIAFVRNRDIWLTDFEGNDTQLTYCSCNQEDPSLRCGVAEYMMQEEFHRFTGYYWSPPIHGDNKRIERILYLETSELNVEQVHISKSPSKDTPLTDSIRYPRAGMPNARSTIKIVEFEIGDMDAQPVNIVHKQLWREHDIKTQFPWMEYIVRFGWLPDGQSVWLQILSRDQQKTAVLKMNVDQFTVAAASSEYKTEILWEETSDYWINIADVFYFLQSSTTEHTRLIWSSEKVNGFRHLFLVEKRSQQKEAKVTQITSGNWCCTDRPLFVDESRSLVYFSAKIHTPLETQFYVTLYAAPTQPILLTRPGFSHSVTMTSPDYFVDCFSTIHDPQIVSVHKLDHQYAISELSTMALLMPVPLKSSCETPPSPPPSANVKESYLTANQQVSGKFVDCIEPNGEIFDFVTSDGDRLYGYLYKPRCYQPGQSYPTLLHIYGGPKTQLVMNEFKFPRLMRYLMAAYFGFAVVVIDSRGSSDRGLGFESHIQHKLGTVELKDQLEGLQFLHDTQFGALPTDSGEIVSVLDLSRLAVTGWSYGGYLSLMALAQYPDRFKMAIAGAPVTQWELYDAAYTERYMGLPNQNPKAYHDSSVLSYIEQFPDNENRLLIAHGLIDENVHFINTEMLVSQLVKHGKPHYLQVYPSEKHGLRHASVNEHFETLMFYWLTNYL